MVRRMIYVEPHPKSGVYRIRREYPASLHDILKRKSRTRSLGTKNLAEANRLAPAVLAGIQREIDDAEAILRAATNGGQPAQLSLTYCKGDDLIAAWRDRHLKKTFKVKTRWEGGAEDYLVLTDDSAKGGKSSEPERRWQERPEEMVSLYYSERPVPLAILNATLDAILAESGFVLPQRHPLRQPLRGLLQDAVTTIRLHTERWGRDKWRPEDRVFDAEVAPDAVAPVAAIGAKAPPAAIPSGRPRITVTELKGKYFRRQKPSPQTKKEQELAVKRFLSFLGRDPYVDEVDYHHADEFYEVLRQCQEFRVWAAVEHQAARALTKRSPKMTAN